MILFFLIFIIIFAFFEIISRIIYIIHHKTYKSKGIFLSLLFPLNFDPSIFFKFGKINKSRVKNLFRLESQINITKINKNEYINNFAKINRCNYQKIIETYSGYDAFEKLEYEPFIGLTNKKNTQLNYANINKKGFQDTIVPEQNNKIIKNIMIVGNSLAFGLGASSVQSNITNSLYNYLNNNASTKNIHWQILNFSFISSESISEMNQINKYISIYKPDYIVQIGGYTDLYFYINNNNLYSYNQGEQIKEYLYSSIFTKILINISIYSYFFRILVKILRVKK
tara:strand:- start:1077 stop:1925 length:849 start_codon:yes stop_codon:yes gene_type:complete